MQETITQEQVRLYFRKVIAQHKLPPLPAVVATAIKLIGDPDRDIRKLCRVLSDDAALAGRILSVARSAYFGQRRLPSTLQEAIRVVGLELLKQITLAYSMQSLFTGHTELSERLWNHSLATALAGQILAQRAGSINPDRAFLAGLLHDVGEMILLHGDPKGFERLYQQAQTEKALVIDTEKGTYGFDHTLIGLTLLDCWNLDAELGNAIVNHHEYKTECDTDSLESLLRMADYLADSAGLGFFSERPLPNVEVLGLFECGSEEGLGELQEQILQRFEEERALFTGS